MKEYFDSIYQAEHVDDYISLCAGEGPISSIEIDDLTYDRIGRLAEHYKLTRRQMLTKLINNMVDKLKTDGTL